jgi:hypothetical protein
VQSEAKIDTEKLLLLSLIKQCVLLCFVPVGPFEIYCRSSMSCFDFPSTVPDSLLSV